MPRHEHSWRLVCTMVSHAKKKKRAEDAAALPAAAERGGDESSSESGSDYDDAPAPARPAKRAKADAAAPQPGGASGTPGWRNKEKPLVLCSRGIPGR